MDAPTRNVQRSTGGDHAAQGITDVSQLRFEEGLEEVDLHFNEIVDVSGPSLPEGLATLYLLDNQIVDVLHHQEVMP
mgnify:CR=1 FL=1|jgi:hypothetical protein